MQRMSIKNFFLFTGKLPVSIRTSFDNESNLKQGKLEGELLLNVLFDLQVDGQVCKQGAYKQQFREIKSFCSFLDWRH